jgi:hypothetical protein
MLAASPKDRGPSAPSLRMATGMRDCRPKVMQHTAQLLCLPIGLAGMLLNTTCLPSSLLT